MRVDQAVILVGGKGERLRPLTDNNPKPMVAACDKPFLEYLVLLLRSNGIRKFLFLAGYHGDKIKAYFNDGSNWGVKIDYSFEEKFMGTGGALKLARDKLESKFFLLFGDSYLPINYIKMADEYTNNKKKVLLAVYDNKDDTGVPFNIAIDKSNKLISSYNKGKNNAQNLNFCDAGVLVVDKEVIGLIRDKTPVSFEETVYPELIAKDELSYYIAENRFYDIGNIERLKDFERFILTKTIK
ncbi:MAG: sugar phosphate nucleotidyltransferase [Candidatus Omnitrophica bacterium]|nr:sugar phosphate nucleotidyltransferase [Candidatus Omnitrophota bacterium]